jgi:hypothetical protein
MEAALLWCFRSSDSGAMAAEVLELWPFSLKSRENNNDVLRISVAIEGGRQEPEGQGGRNGREGRNDRGSTE